MRLKAFLVLTAFAAATIPAVMPASAQSGYRLRSCGEGKRDNQVGGAILGGLIGGVLGSNVAASGHRGDGTAVGAVLGGLVGQGIGKDATRCIEPRQRDTSGYVPGTYNPNYNSQPGYNTYGYGAPPSGLYPYDPSDSGYRSGAYGDDYPQHEYGSGLYRSDRPTYSRNDDYAGSDCSQATQVTRLPDGREIHQPVEVCRDAYYGDWRVKD